MVSHNPRRRHLAALGAAAWLAACGGDDGPKAPALPGGGTTTVQAFASGLNAPWGMAFLPDGRLLVTEKGGSLQLISADGTSRSAVGLSLPGGLNTTGQGGLLDVAIDPQFASGQPWVYLSYSQPGVGGTGTAVMRGQLDVNNPDALTGGTEIFQQLPKTTGPNHFGSRLVFAGNDTLFVTLGERFEFAPAQDPDSHLGKVVRIHRNGALPIGNPTIGTAQRGIWSLGHRNPQGAALHPVTGELWVGEHGPQGGDEINIALAGRNFGWPLVSYGCTYGDPIGTACAIGGGTHAPTFTEPLTTWVPTSIAPSGMAFYTGTMFPEWQGNLFVGALAGTALWRLTVTDSAVTAREEILGIDVRVRDVAQGPDGAIYFIDESNGRIMRIAR
ncbi:MAG TPA: PQQ-dependent sugar dehydrogenase [Burkholderiaceae bacterium]